MEMNLRYGIKALHDLFFAKPVFVIQKQGHMITRGLITSYDVRFANHNKDEPTTSAAAVHVLVADNHKAFVAVQYDDPFTRWDNDKLVWTNVGNHDSCWIDSIESALSEIYFTLAESCDPTVAPIKLHKFVSHQMGTSVTFVEVDMMRDDSNPKLSGAWAIADLKKISMDEFSKIGL